MTDLKLVNGDLVFEDNDFSIVDEDEELIQSSKSILSTRKGEDFFDSEKGLSRDNLLGKQADQDAARDDIVEALAYDERIQEVVEITFSDDPSKRTRSLFIKIKKQNDEVVEIGEVEI